MIDAYGAVQLDTYFNSFSVAKWKANCEIKTLSFAIEFRGHISLIFSHHRLGHSCVKLYEIKLEHHDRARSMVELPFWAALQDGILSVEIRALTSSEIFGGSFLTADPPVNNVSLGIVVTTFNRQSYVLRAIDRLTRELFADPRFGHAMKLVVVDNGRNLEAEPNPHLTVIPNPNLGGAGGFTRGLIHLQDCGTYTHCLFMDDDATCEVESLRRTFRLLQYCKNKSITISGAMLREDRMHIQYENGAVFKKGTLKAIMRKLDLRNIDNLLKNEMDWKIDYAGWWFFAFPLDMVTHYAFPFFVKGDDWTFCIKHAPHIVSMNGIASWQEAFEFKISPFTVYLYTRAHLASNLLLDGGMDRHRFAQDFLQNIYQNCNAYNYDRARAVCEAVSDVLKGPDFWRENVDMIRKRSRLQHLRDGEGRHKLGESIKLNEKRRPARRFVLRKPVQGLLFNGHLLPWLFLGRKNAIIKSTAPSAEVFRKQRALYYDDVTMMGYWVQHSKKRYFGNLLLGLRLYVALLLKFKRLKKAYRAAYPELTSRAFWERHFNPAPEAE